MIRKKINDVHNYFIGCSVKVCTQGHACLQLVLNIKNGTNTCLLRVRFTQANGATI